MLYLDASALVKLIVVEPETGALRRYLEDRTRRVTSELSVAEVLRAAQRNSPILIQPSRRLLARVARIALVARVVERAGTLSPPAMRTLDALHIATALEVRDELDAIVSYDRRLLEAADGHGLPTASPV